MKKILLLIVFINLQFINAQKCLMQPALNESNKMYDNLQIYKQLPDQDEYLEAVIQNFTFDDDKNPTSDTYEKYDENGVLIKQTRSTRTYYPFDEYVRERYPSSLPFNEYTREIFNPNLNIWLLEQFGKSTKNEKYWYRGTSESYEVSNYDENFNITNRFKKSSTSNDDLPMDMTYYSWDSNTDIFSPSYKYLLNNTFDVGVLTERIIDKITDFNTNNPQTYQKEEFFEDDVNHLYQKITFTWNGTSWNQSRIKQVSYTNDLMTEVIESNWNDADSEWVEDNLSLYTHDANGNIITFQYYYQNQLKYSDAFTYDSDNLLIERISNRSDTGTGDLEYTKRYVYNYTQDNLAINDTNLIDVTLYPNPVKNSINISTDKLFDYTIVSIQGSRVLQGSSQNTIDVQNLINGLYFITLDIDNKQITKKIIVNK